MQFDGGTLFRPKYRGRFSIFLRGAGPKFRKEKNG